MLRRLHPVRPDSFEFTPANLEWAQAQITKYPEGRQQSAIIPVLWRAQEQEGWLTKPAIEYVADMLGMAYIRVLEVATFYTMYKRRPVGKYHVGVCTTSLCAVMGGDDWKRWINQLADAGVLAPGFRTLNYTYIGSELTWPIYWNGTLGRAKVDLDSKAQAIRGRLGADAARVVALKAETGAQIWKTYTIADAPHPTRTNAIGTQLFGPAGASVWSAPTIDVQRKALYVATSNSYADPATDTSDAILAFDLSTGKMLWHQQATPKDSFVVACFGTDQSNCPQDRGPDHDFGQSPILVNLRDGHRELVIGQKSGVVHALDPDHEGKILWQTRIGKGGPLGGTEWGSAADQDRIYVANSDVRFLMDGSRRLNSSEGGGLFGLDLATGKIAMQVAPVAYGDRPQCSPALSAAVTAIPGVVFSGGVSGFLRAYATDDAKLLWEFDTAREYTTVNGVPGHGGAMDGPGPVVVDGMLYVNSGYAQWSGLPGNVLLAFEVGNP